MKPGRVIILVLEVWMQRPLPAALGSEIVVPSSALPPAGPAAEVAQLWGLGRREVIQACSRLNPFLLYSVYAMFPLKEMCLGFRRANVLKRTKGLQNYLGGSQIVQQSVNACA